MPVKITKLPDKYDINIHYAESAFKEALFCPYCGSMAYLDIPKWIEHETLWDYDRTLHKMEFFDRVKKFGLLCTIFGNTPQMFRLNYKCKCGAQWKTDFVESNNSNFDEARKVVFNDYAFRCKEKLETYNSINNSKKKTKLEKNLYNAAYKGIIYPMQIEEMYNNCYGIGFNLYETDLLYNLGDSYVQVSHIEKGGPIE